MFIDMLRSTLSGGYRKPQIWDVLLFKIIFCPYRLVRYIIWNVHWIWKFDYKGMEYGPEEEVYLTRKVLKLSPAQWEVCTYSIQLWLARSHVRHLV